MVDTKHMVVAVPWVLCGVIAATCPSQAVETVADAAFQGLVRETGTLSQGRFELVATTVGAKAMFAGGARMGGFRSDRVDIYDSVTGLWSTAALSQPRYHFAATTAGGKAIFAGGITESPDGRAVLSAVVDIYDDEAGFWTTATLSEARVTLAATAVGDKALFAGGASSGYDNTVDIYDTESGAWSTASLSQRRESLAATTVGNKAIFAGGYTTGNTRSTAVDIYDGDSDSWSTATLSVGRSHLAATTVGSKALFAGGYIATGDSDVVDIYDADTGQWSTATLSQPRHYLAATTLGSLAIFGGGEQSNVPVPVRYSDVVDVYDALTDTWSVTTLSEARCHLAATTVGGKAIFAGGISTRLPAGSNVVDVFEVPEPATLALLALGGLALIRRRRR